MKGIGVIMVRIAICDDDLQFLNQTKEALLAWSVMQDNIYISCFQDGDSLIQAHTSSPFDIIILDIVMPLFNGIEVSKEIRAFDNHVKIVFLTSSEEFAIQSYSVKATNYLLKPLVTEQLYSCLHEIISELAIEPLNLLVKEGHLTHIINIKNIAYVESLNKIVLIHLTNGNTIQSTEPLYNFENTLTLDNGFFKCNRSFIVNIYQIATYSAKEITLVSGTRIPISRNQHQAFVDAYFKTFFAKVGDF